MAEDRPGGEPMVAVTLTTNKGDWRTDPLRVVAGIRHGGRKLDEWQRVAVAEGPRARTALGRDRDPLRCQSTGGVGAVSEGLLAVVGWARLAHRAAGQMACTGRGLGTRLWTGFPSLV